MYKLVLPEALLLEIQDLQSKLNFSYSKLGSITSTLERMDMELEIVREEQKKILDECFSLEDDHRIIRDKVVSEYGEGELDLNTGQYKRS